MLEGTPLLNAASQSDEATNNGAQKQYNAFSSDNHADDHEEESGEIQQSIGFLGSLSLIVNNLTGPAMLGFPALFQKAGIIPVVIAVSFVYVSSSLCGTFLADAIASIPGNKTFSKHIDFSTAFKLIVGDHWYIAAETLFLISCGVQACASLVETAQSLDGFLASFMLGKTYALQLYPTVEFVTWSTSLCHAAEDDRAIESGSEDCTPFHDAGPLILTLGFVLTTIIFLPLGRGHLKETIAVQIFSFLFMALLLAQFSFEFFYRGWTVSLPWVGEDVSQLAGVVLFNYAFSITVPAWLCEKHPSVSVNKTIWTSTTLASLLYIFFGAAGASAFQDVSPNMLVLLASSKVMRMTRLCAALFGVTIIGCGVPVYCVIIKNALEFSGLCSPPFALLWGSIMPYVVSWALYQGSLLMSLLNWTGLVVNGFVAFLLPMVLALKATELKAQRRNVRSVHMFVDPAQHVTALASSTSPSHLELVEKQQLQQPKHTEPLRKIESMQQQESKTSNKAMIEEELDEQSHGKYDHQDDSVDNGWLAEMRLDHETNNYNNDVEQQSSSSINEERRENRSQLLSARLRETRVMSSDTVEPLPAELDVYRREIVLFMMMSFACIIFITMLEDALEGINPDVANDRRRYRM